MLWITLWKKLGKQPMKKMQSKHVYAKLENPKTHIWESIPLYLKYDRYGNPYLAKEEQKKGRD